MPHGPVEVEYSPGLLVTCVIGSDPIEKQLAPRSRPLVAGAVYEVERIAANGNLIVRDAAGRLSPRFAGFDDDGKLNELRNDRNPMWFEPFVRLDAARNFIAERVADDR